MMAEQTSHRRLFFVGCLLCVLGSAGLMTFPLVHQWPLLSQPSALFTLMCGLVAAMGVGATLAIFATRRL